jgi:hypothetical protein
LVKTKVDFITGSSLRVLSQTAVNLQMANITMLPTRDEKKNGERGIISFDYYALHNIDSSNRRLDQPMCCFADR